MRLLLTTTCLALGTVIAMSATANDSALPVIELDEVPALTTPVLLEPESDLTLTYGGYTGLKYRSNIYKESTNEESDIIGIFAPGVAVRTDMDEHELTAKLLLESGTYFDNSENNYFDADLQLGGQYDIGWQEYITLHSRFRYDHIDIGGFNDISEFGSGTSSNRAEEPTPYRFFQIGGTYHAPINSSYFGEVGVIGSLYNYDNVSREDGTRLIQDDRDRHELLGHVKLGHYHTAEIRPFVEVEVNTRQYDEQIDSSAINSRDSNGVGVFVGVDYNEAHKDPVWAEARIGYVNQDYTDTTRPDVNTVGLNIKSGYQIDNATSLRFNASRTVRELTLNGASGFIQSKAELRAFHDITPKVTVDGGVHYSHNDFQINPASGRAGRVDDIYGGTLGVTYNIQKPLYARLGYEYLERTSDERNAEYHDNTILLNIGVRF